MSVSGRRHTGVQLCIAHLAGGLSLPVCQPSSNEGPGAAAAYTRRCQSSLARQSVTHERGSFAKLTKSREMKRRQVRRLLPPTANEQPNYTRATDTRLLDTPHGARHVPEMVPDAPHTGPSTRTATGFTKHTWLSLALALGLLSDFFPKTRK